MPSTVEQLSPSRVKLTVEIPFSELKSHLAKAYREIASQVSIPGFRKGKVPSAVIDQRFGRGMVLQEAINAALPGAYAQAVEEAKLTPLSEPEVEVTKLEDGDVVEFVADVEVRPALNLPDFSTLKATVAPLATGESQVDEQVELMRQRFATTNEVDRPAADGDVVTIDLLGTADGEELPDATAEGVSYTIGSGGMLDGLDEAVTGLSAGESAEFSSTLVGGPLAGEAADIKVTVTKVSEQKLPELDDEFAQLISEFDTVDEMREDLARAAAEYAKVDQLNEARDRVLEALIAVVDFELPERLLAAEIASRHEQVNDQLRRAGLTLDRYLDESGEEAQAEEDFWAEMDERTIQGLKAQILLDTIADERELGVNQNELTEMIVRKARANNTTPEAEAQHMMEHNHMPEWMQEIRRNKALAHIVAEAEVTDTDGNNVELKLVEDATDVADATEDDADQV
ncbi:MAG: trigger factor [Micropruina sp.]